MKNAKTNPDNFILVRSQKLYKDEKIRMSTWLRCMGFETHGNCEACVAPLTLLTFHCAHGVPSSQLGSEWQANRFVSCVQCNTNSGTTFFQDVIAKNDMKKHHDKLNDDTAKNIVNFIWEGIQDVKLSLSELCMKGLSDLFGC